jgi:hypothetical protein
MAQRLAVDCEQPSRVAITRQVWPCARQRRIRVWRDSVAQSSSRTGSRSSAAVQASRQVVVMISGDQRRTRPADVETVAHPIR